MKSGITWFLLFCQWVYGSKVDMLTFDGPYDEVDTNGNRKLKNEFRIGGSTEIKQYFARLTPDRQSKKGFIWSINKIGKNEFSAVVAFRISGQGKKWYGDGIGVWFTQYSGYINGDNHGFTEKYVGVGIILDTFYNADHKGGHKDVTVMINDGTKTLDMLNDETKIGCDAAMRYHEGHAAFNPVYSSSRLKVQVKGKDLRVSIDPNASGEWTKCYEGAINLPENWAETATIGLTAATGALADNHDILRLTTYAEADDPEISETDSDALIHNLSKEYDQWFESESCGADCKISILQKKIKDFQVDFEHKMTDLKEKTENTVGKLKKQEQANENKIQDLEKIVSGMVDKTMSTKMNIMGKRINSKIEQHVEANVVATSGTWKTPFFLLVIGICGGSFFLYRKYQQLRKTHLL